MKFFDDVKQAYDTKPKVKLFAHILGGLIVLGILFAVFG